MPDISEAAVISRPDATGSNRLIAFVTSESGAIDQATLSSFLATKLPDHMLPSVTVTLDALPRTPSGKIDRIALGAMPLQIQASSSPPRTQTEEGVAKIWRDHLEREFVGVDDDFFELGGHSLMAIVITISIQEDFGVRMPLRNFFEAGTVAETARFIDGELASMRSFGRPDELLGEDEEEGTL